MQHLERIVSRVGIGRRLVAVVLFVAMAASLTPTIAADPAAAQASGDARTELVGRRTLTSKSFDNGDGTVTTEAFPGPVHFLRAGQWRDIKPGLVETRDPAFAWRNEAGPFSARFARHTREGFWQFTVAGMTFGWTIDGAGRAEGRAEGSRASYDGVFPGVDVEYEVLATGVKETLVLADRDVPARYHFLLEPPSDVELEPRKLPDGSWGFFRPQDTRPLFLLERPYATDAAGDREVTGQAESNASMSVRLRGKGFVVSVALDREWLQSEDRRFPVRLDPTMTIQPPEQDANWPMTCNCTAWLHDKLFIGTSDDQVWRPTVQFDLSAVPAGATVTGAELKTFFDGFYVSVSGTKGWERAHDLNVHRMTAAWDVNVNTSPDLQYEAAAEASFHLPVGAGDQWMAWDVASSVTGWLDGTVPNHGLMLKRSDETLGMSGPVVPGMRYTTDTAVRPKLEITYVSDAVSLRQPDTLHADGAELSWSRYTGPSGAPFERYEVHRSTDPSFSPSPDTHLTTIRDANVTAYRDTTAAPSTTFHYRVVANQTPSEPVAVTLPADGRSTKTLQPGPTSGQATFLNYSTQLTNCANYGADSRLFVGTDLDSTLRPTVRFGLSDLPAGATIEQATLSLWQAWTIDNAETVDAHRVTAAWKEGTGQTECTGDGATWYEQDGGVEWTSDGGDVDPTPAASYTVVPGEDGWHTFDVAGLVQGWVDGTWANHGVLLKFADETMNADRDFAYHSDDYTAAPSQRPKLELVYVDGSHAQGPTVAIADPGAGAQVAGDVTVDVAASDDRRVEQVQVLVDGAVVATDTVAPWTATWDSTTVANGAHTISAQATDDAGNTTTSADASITVENTLPPTVTLTGPADGSTVSGVATLSADASDDVAVEQVTWLVDDVQVAVDTTAPYDAPWDTLDPGFTAYDGTHTVIARATDTSGQATTSAPATVTVDNTSDTIYRGSFTAVSKAPQEAVYDPAKPDQDDQPVQVTVTNNSNTTWDGAQVQVRSRWIPQSATAPTVDGPAVSIGNQLRKGKSITVTVAPDTPVLPEGSNKEAYSLRVDLYDATNDVWFASRGNAPSDQAVVVRRELAVDLGLEGWHHYEPVDLGAGLAGMVNVASGNLLARLDPLSSVGRGLNTNVSLTYNALEAHSNSPVGNNFSLAVSSLSRLGAPLDVHPNKADEIAGRSNRWVAFTDGDGTTHRFDGHVANDGTVYWTAPAGVHLYLRTYSDTDSSRKWALTRPDGVTFFYDVDGYPTGVEDRNGNQLQFVLEAVPPGEDPGGYNKRVVEVIDAAGVTDGAPDRSYTIDYYSKAEATKPQVRGNVQTIVDHDGSALRFDYYLDGNLRRLTQAGGTTATGAHLPDRHWTFTYTTADGSGPAITDPTARLDPDPRTPAQSTRLYSVVDPRGNETTFAYLGPGNGQQRWNLASFTDRSGAATTFSYDGTTLQTTVAMPEARTSVYSYDARGQVTGLVDPAGRAWSYRWSDDRLPIEVVEPTGASRRFSYNDNGQLTDTWNQAAEHTELTYENLPVDSRDTSAYWKTGRSIPHLSQVATKTDPNGTATTTVTGDYRWQFGYDAAGNLTSVTDPEGHATSHTYNPDGTLASTTDPNSHTTTYDTYDPSGQPTQVTNPAGDVTTVGYTPDGRTLWIQDPEHQDDTGTDAREYRTWLDYDAFGRLGRTSGPKSTDIDRGTLIWTATHFDANDNVTEQVAEHYGDTYPGTGPVTTHVYDAMDRRTLTTGPDTTVDPAGERTTYSYDPAGRLLRSTNPRGVLDGGDDRFGATDIDYDQLDRPTRITRYHFDAVGTFVEELHSHRCYDTAGDLVSTTAPKAALATIDCANPPGYTTSYSYDLAHRRTSSTDPEGNTTTVAYDDNGNVTTVVDAENSTTTRAFDQRGLPVQITRDFDTAAGRQITTKLIYDPAGNLVTEVSPRGWDVAAGTAPFGDYTTSYVYDAADRLVRTDLPTDASTAAAYVHRALDGNGRPVWTSQPVATADPAQVADDDKTTIDWFDAGWVRATGHPSGVRAHFDYNARGQQTTRTPETDTGELATDQQLVWDYHVDGTLKKRSERDGQTATYRYDANNNLIVATDAGGANADSQQPVDVQADYDGLDRPGQVRHRQDDTADWTTTDYAWDPNGNVDTRLEEPTDGSAATTRTFTYDQADRPNLQTDDAGTPTDASDDQTVDSDWTPTGREDVRTIRRNGALKQTTDWSWHANGRLDALTVTDGAGNVESQHDPDYLDGGVYVNGHRTRDIYQLDNPDTAAPCQTTTCTATFAYDARGRVTAADLGHGLTIDYTLDLAGNVVAETRSDGTNISNSYLGQQLISRTVAGITTDLHYDHAGNLGCVALAGQIATTDANNDGLPDACEGTTPDVDVLEQFVYDDLDRLLAYSAYDGTGSVTDDADYTYDPLDRTITQTETHDATDRTTDYGYLGLTGLLATETQSDGTGTPTYTKSYARNPAGQLVSMTRTDETNGSVDRFTYGTDPHGSISLLLDDAGQAQAAYGYQPYGATDPALTHEIDPATSTETAEHDPLNPYRYTAKRIDTGTGTLDMGARRYAPDLTRFLQRDRYDGALADLGLSTDPLTGNRYALAAGNPISYIESDGHRVMYDGSGGSYSTSDASSDDGGGGWSAAGSFASSLGANAWSALSGIGELLSNPAGTFGRAADSLSDTYQQSRSQGDSAGMAALTAVNQINPVYHGLVAGDQALQAARSGNWARAGSAGADAVWAAFETVGVAAGGAGLAARGSGLSRTAAAGRTSPRGSTANAYSVAYEVELPASAFGRSRSVHFNRANAALDDALKGDASFASAFDDLIPGASSSVSSVGGRATPTGWTWHHVPSSAAQGRTGVMHLVPSWQHAPGSNWQQLLHPGGFGGYAEWAIPRGAPR